MSYDELKIFEDYFYRDLEKGYSADIACCDHCYDEFLSMWPYADYADDHYFQTQGIGLDDFYSGTYLRDEYTKAEFDQFICQLECPRCGSPLGGTIWVYELPFSVPAHFDRTVTEVSELASATPFLLLEHAFCREILDAIRDLSALTAPTRYAAPLFRARSEVRGSIPAIVESFDFPPPQFVQEGRYNHAGHSVLYLGSDKETCHAELRFAPSVVLEFELLPEVRVLDLVDPYSQHSAHADLLNCLVYSALVSARQDGDGWHRPHYVVSRFVADCARAAQFDAVRYPSTRRTVSNFNLVIVNQSLTLIKTARAISYHKLNAA